jgi:hypothetical protein
VGLPHVPTDWPDDLARQKAERDDAERKRVALARAAALTMRRAIVRVVVDQDPMPCTLEIVAAGLAAARIRPPADLPEQLTVLVEQGHLIEAHCVLNGHTAEGWALEPGFAARMVQRGIEQEVARLEPGWKAGG